MINKKRGLLILCMILLLGGLVSAIPQTFSVHGKLENNAGSPLEGTYNMSFNIYNAYTGGSSIWNLSNQNVDTDSNGIYNVVLTSVNLDFGSQYYLGVTVGNDSEMSPRINLSSSPYAFEAQNVSVSGVRFNSNVDFGTNYNFTFDGGTLFVDGSKGYVGIGTITPNATLHIVKPGVSGDNVTIIHSGGGANDLMLIGNSGYPYAVFSEANTNDPGNLQLKYVGVTTISLLANGNTYFNNGNVGIGTTTPQQKLHVNGSILANGTINATTDVCIQGGACLSSAGTGSGTISGSGTSNYVPLWNGTSSINKSNIYQGASGNIGIGTVNPISRLEINSAANGGPAGLNINFATRTNTEDSTSAINVTGTLAKGTVFKVEAGGNVGIGTSSPQQKLDVVGNINSTGFINATTDVCIQGGACLSSVSASAGGWTKTGTQVALTTATDNVSIGSTDFFVDNSKGYVSIGTTSPEGRLEVSNLDTDTANTLLIRKPTEATGTDVGGLRFVTGSGAISSSNAIAGIEADITQANPSSLKGELTFSTNRGDSYTEAMRIDDSGYVGIGTTTPATPLDIDTGSNSLGLRLRGLAETVEIGDMYMGTNGEMIISTVGGSGGQAFIDLRSEDDNYGLILRQSNGTGISPYANFYVTDAATDYLNIVVNVAQGTKGLVIDENENVGIGTTTPQQKLHVNGNILANGTINATSDVCIQGGACLSSAGTGSGTISGSGTSNYVPLWNGTSSINNSNIYQGASGNIGIGTTGPTSKLGVKDTATDGALTSTLRLWQEGSGSGTGASIELGFADNSLSSASIGGFYDGAGRGLSFNTALSGVALSEKMRITSAGYVGIGTTTPQQKLHVNGSILANGTINATTDLCIQGGACLSSAGTGSGTISGSGTSNYVPLWNGTSSINKSNIYQGASGNIGIGTVNPISRLEINSAANGGPAGLNINFATRTNTEDSTSAINVTGTLAKGTVFKVEAGGNVGIGTSSPQQKLDVVGNINSTGFINATTDVCIQGGACLSTVSASAGGWTKTGTQGALTTATDNVSIGSTDFFVDNSKGYVGIGTTAPKKELDIVGNIKVSGYVYSNGCPNDMA